MTIADIDEGTLRERARNWGLREGCRSAIRTGAGRGPGAASPRESSIGQRYRLNERPIAGERAAA
jgi:hypothetical protein